MPEGVELNTGGVLGAAALTLDHPLMPEGVEHSAGAIVTSAPAGALDHPLMPEGVEHDSEAIEGRILYVARPPLATPTAASDLARAAEPRNPPFKVGADTLHGDPGVFPGRAPNLQLDVVVPFREPLPLHEIPRLTVLFPGLVCVYPKVASHATYSLQSASRVAIVVGPA